MHGLMQDWPLLCHRIIDHAATFHGERKIISRSVEGPIHTTTYADARARALKVAQRLEKDGIRLGDRVATLVSLTDLYRRLGRLDEAGAAYARALSLVRQEAERRFLERRLEEVQGVKGA